ncbi:MAG UNVERIFIED_CONTAM: hypothetical protein LVR29_16045 [Microcystis novacekii LVE1205-3]|jgi:twitching motility protein PilJ
MTAMEEGIQQVIDVTERSEQAKKSLEDIIQVSNRIDTLVRIDYRRYGQTTGKFSMSPQVMQSVELTAQETSQEFSTGGGFSAKIGDVSCREAAFFGRTV